MIRTGNAGVLVTLDGTRVLVDGLCGRVGAYPETPAHIVQSLLDNPPDVLLYTHSHQDHYSATLISPYENSILRPITGPEDVSYNPFSVGNLKITPIKTRHLGKVEPNLSHTSYLIEGSKKILVTGDSAPTCFKDFPKADVAVVPYAYCTTPSAWALTKSICDRAVLVHMPAEEEDAYGLWPLVREVTQNDPVLTVAEIGNLLYF